MKTFDMCFFFYFMLIFIDLFWLYGVFVAVPASLVVEGGVDVVLGLLAAGASPVVERGLWVYRFRELGFLGSRARSTVAHGLRCSAACGVFMDQGLNPCLLHRQARATPELPGKP